VIPRVSGRSPIKARQRAGVNDDLLGWLSGQSFSHDFLSGEG
jgi:hypothetical protein